MSDVSYVLTRNGEPIRKAFEAREAWGDDYVIGHPRDAEGICILEDGTRMEVISIPLGADTWRIRKGDNVSYFYGTSRDLLKSAGWLDTAERLEWDGWVRVYSA